MVFMEQGNDCKDVYFTGAGTCQVIRRIENKSEIFLGEIESGQMMGQQQAMFNTLHVYSVRSKSYCTLGIIEQEIFQEMSMVFPQVSTQINSQIVNNPFDIECQYFITVCRKRIPYFKTLSEKILKDMYYSSDLMLFDINQKLFSAGNKCKDIFIVMQGVLQIDLTDGTNEFMLELMGRGSVIG